jgi:hypothetical protein
MITAKLQQVRKLARPITRRLLMLLVALITLVFWLPFGRALIEGGTYEWGIFGLGRDQQTFPATCSRCDHRSRHPLGGATGCRPARRLM